MIYLSKLLNQKVWDAFGHVVGKLDDLLVDKTDQPMPPITAIAIKDGSPECKLVDAKDIATLWPSITLNVDLSKLDLYEPTGHELYLKQRALDQQIVDTEGKRVVRVNDLQIARKNNNFYRHWCGVWGERGRFVAGSGRGESCQVGSQRPSKSVRKTHVIPSGRRRID